VYGLQLTHLTQKSLENESGPIHDLMKFIVSKTPRIEVPWLTDHLKELALANEQTSGDSKALTSGEAPSMSQPQDKMEVEGEESGAASAATPVQQPQLGPGYAKLYPLTTKRMEFRHNSTKVKKKKKANKLKSSTSSATSTSSNSEQTKKTKASPHIKDGPVK